MSYSQTDYKFCPFCRSSLVLKTVDAEARLSCPSCEFVHWNNPKPVVSVILEKDNTILMLKRAQEPLKGYWCLPGGFIRHEETPEEAVIREAKEETHININSLKLVGVYRIDNDPRGIHVDIVYSAKFRGEIHLSSEDSEYNFFNVDNLPKDIAYKHKDAIDDYLHRV